MKRKTYGALAFILLISCIAYLPVFHNGLLNWDDDAYIKHNPLVHSINLKEIFSENVLGNYHPVTMLVFAIEYHFFGLNAAGYHAVNLALHLLNIILVFNVVFLLSGKRGVAMVASLFFGIHPLHVESVAWAAELKDMLYAFFFLASCIFYLKYLKKGQKKFYTFALLLFAVSLLSKAMAASLPLVFILTDYFRGRKINMRTLLEKVPFLLMALIFGIVAVFAQKSSDAIPDVVVSAFPQRLVYGCYGFITYLVKLLFPLNLSAFYPYPVNEGEDIPVWYYAYVLAFIALVISIIYTRRYSKMPIFGMGFFLVTIFLVLQLLPVGRAIMADRYSYIPSIGIFYLAGEGIALLWNKKQKWAVILLLGVFAVFFSVRTYARCGVWKDGMTLWNDVISQYKNVPFVYNNRGNLFFDEKRNAEALSDFNRAIELNPGYANAYYNRGALFMNEKRNDEALSDFNKVVELRPRYADAYNNRGTIFMMENRNTEAHDNFTRAIELKPRYSEAYNNRGIVFMNEHRNDEALQDFNKAIELNPDYADASYNRGTLFMNEKRNDEAVNDFSRVIKLRPGYANGYNNRGIVYMNENRNSEALRDFNQAIKLDPGYTAAYNNRGTLFMNGNRDVEALKDFNKAIGLDSANAEAFYNRANLFYNEKRTGAALDDFNKAIELNPGYKNAYYNRGNLFYHQKRYDDAISNYSKAIELDPGFAQAYYNRGLSAYFTGNKTGACGDMKKANGLGYQPAAAKLVQICR